MGRYAFFNTDYEYKFVFGSQPSSDIRAFGGWSDRRGPHLEPVQIWEDRDKQYILDRLGDFQREFGYELPDWSVYPQSLEGSWALRDWLNDCNEHNEDRYCFQLGCLIYHQLLWTCPLEANYEE
jgi:hypothetical protein